MIARRLRFYIATRLERAADHNYVRDRLVSFGHEITYDWTIHGPVWRSGVDRIREVAAAEMQGVMTADVVVTLLPGGRGTHAELGMGLALRKQIVLHGTEQDFGATPETCAFYHGEKTIHVIGALDAVVMPFLDGRLCQP